MKNNESFYYIEEFYNSIGNDGFHNEITNNVYSKYLQFCKESNHDKICSLIGFSRIIKTYGFTVENKKLFGKKVRIFVNSVQSDGRKSGKEFK